MQGASSQNQGNLYFGDSTTGIDIRFAVIKFGEETEKVVQTLCRSHRVSFGHLNIFAFQYDSNTGEWKVVFSVSCAKDMIIRVNSSRIAVETVLENNSIIETIKASPGMFREIDKEHFVRALETATAICGARNRDDVIQCLQGWVR